MFHTKDLELAPDWLSFHVRICILLYCLFCIVLDCIVHVSCQTDIML